MQAEEHLIAPDHPYLAALEGPMLLLEGARRDALWAIVDPASRRLLAGRIRDRGAAEQLAVVVGQALAALQLRPDAVRHVAVGLGPGSYAGLRIVMSFAKGWAMARGLGIVPFDSLVALAHEVDVRAQLGASAARLVMMNAFSGQLFALGLRADGASWLPSGVYQPAAVRDAVAALGDAALSAWCDGALPMAGELGLSSPVTDLRDVSPAAPLGAVSTALSAVAAGASVAAETLVPAYGQASTAELRANGLV